MARPYLPHPIAMEFPEINAEEFQDLMDSMRSQGFDAHHPIVLFEGKILDGRNRYRAAMEINKQNGSTPVVPTFDEFTGTRQEAVDFSMRSNLFRRHLTPGQRALIAEGMARHTHGGYRPATAAQKDQAAFMPLDNQHQTKTETQKEVAAKVHVSERVVRQARELKTLDPQAAERVKQGKEALGGALKKAKAAAAKPAAPPALKDAADRPIHPNAHLALTERHEAAKRLRNDLLSLGRGIKTFCETPEGRLMRWPELKVDLDNIARVLRYAAPFTSCPMGDPCDEDCELCKGTQWISETQWDHVPREFKR